MTNTELVALLREARSWIGHNLDCTAVCDECVVAGRIDAALAAHEAEERVEWFPLGDDWAAGGGKPGLVLNVTKHGTGWSWSAELRLKAGGFCDTLEEAQRAAIAAARGMK